MSGGVVRNNVFTVCDKCIKCAFSELKEAKVCLGHHLKGGVEGIKRNLIIYCCSDLPSLPLLTQPVYCPKVLSNNK